MNMKGEQDRKERRVDMREENKWTTRILEDIA